MDIPRNATIVSLERHSAVILPFMDGTLSRHVAWMRLRGLSGNTIKCRTDVVRALLTRAGKPLIEITEADLVAWQGTLDLLAPNTRRTYVSHVRTLFRWLADAEIIDRDPGRALVVPKVDRALPRPVPEPTLEQALDHAPIMIRVWLELAGYEGLRAGEVAHLERPDVQDNARVPFLYVRGKGGKTRVVPLSPTVLDSLLELGMPSRGRLFRRTSGRPMTPKDVSRRANDYLHGLGYPETIHQFRHRFGTQALNVSGNLRQVQELMGHASPSTTAIYTLIDPTAAAPAVTAIDHPLLRPVQDTGS